jgi:Protein of unknown function (DUF4058)
MPSPYPGMNPYLEQDLVWHDSHESFMPVARDLLSAQVDPDFVVKIDEHVYIHELPVEPRRLVGRADLGVTRRPEARSGPKGTATLAAPMQVNVPGVDFQRLSYLEVRDRADWRLLTVVELLSPANKYAGPDREQYLAKRAQLLGSAVHLVEIDLLCGGPRLPLEHLPPCDYYVLVSRHEDRPQAGLWPIGLREPLPVIPVPLRPPVADARLALQDIVHRVYDAARYHSWIYSGTPQPALVPEDATWARQFVPSES